MARGKGIQNFCVLNLPLGLSPWAREGPSPLQSPCCRFWSPEELRLLSELPGHGDGAEGGTVLLFLPRAPGDVSVLGLCWELTAQGESCAPKSSLHSKLSSLPVFFLYFLPVAGTEALPGWEKGLRYLLSIM